MSNVRGYILAIIEKKLGNIQRTKEIKTKKIRDLEDVKIKEFKNCNRTNKEKKSGIGVQVVL